MMKPRPGFDIHEHRRRFPASTVMLRPDRCRAAAVCCVGPRGSRRRSVCRRFRQAMCVDIHRTATMNPWAWRSGHGTRSRQSASRRMSAIPCEGFWSDWGLGTERRRRACLRRSEQAGSSTRLPRERTFAQGVWTVCDSHSGFGSTANHSGMILRSTTCSTIPAWATRTS